MKSFLEGKRNFSTDSLRPIATAHALHSDVARQGLAHAVPGASSAHVEVVKEGDKIVRLVVHCVCGERVEVECLYPAGR